MLTLSPLQSLLFYTYRFLCGAVLPHLRALKVDVDEASGTLFFCAYYDGEVSRDDEISIKALVVIVTRAMSGDFPSYQKVEKVVQRLDYPYQIPQEGHFVYLRDESILDGARTAPIITPELYFSHEAPVWVNLSFFMMRALLGKVRPNLRAGKEELDERNKIIYLWFYIDGTILPEDREILNEVVNEAKDVFGPTYSLNLSIERLDYPQKIPSIGTAFFRQDEYEVGNEEEDLPEYDRENRWYTLETAQHMSDPENDFSIRKLLLNLKSACLGKIQAHWRALQYAVDPLQNSVHLWLYINNQATEQDTHALESIIEEIEESAKNYTIEKRIIVLSPFGEIPANGRYFFLRKAPSGFNKLEKEPADLFTKLAEWSPSKVHQLWPAPRENPDQKLRAVHFALNSLSKKFSFFFFFDGEWTSADEASAKVFVEDAKKQFFPEYEGNNYLARYDKPEKIPEIGECVYSSQHEIEAERAKLRWSLINWLEDATRRALIGRITPNLVSLSATVNELKNSLHFCFCFDGEISDSDFANAQRIAQYPHQFWPDFSCQIDTGDFKEGATFAGRLIYFRSVN